MPPSRKSHPPQKLELATNSLRNTTVAADDDTIFYEIVTRFWHPSVTKINKIDMESRQVMTIAEIDGLPEKEPKVRFDGEMGQWMPVNDFMKFDEDTIGGSFTANSGVEYKWQTYKGHLQLVRADDEEQTPIVEFHSHKRHLFVFRMSRRAFLEVKLSPEINEAMDKLIVSYLLVERRRRDARIRLKLEKS